MSLSTMPAEQLEQIAAAGGGFRLDATYRATDDLVRIAAAARTAGSRITFAGMAPRMLGDLVRIAAAGGGCICFED